MRTYYRKRDIFFGLFYILLFLFSIRFLNRNNTFLLLTAGVVFYLCLVQRHLYISMEVVILFIYGLTYYYFSVKWGTDPGLTYFVTSAIGAPLLYIVGQNIILLFDNRENRYKKICWICSVGMFLFAMLGYLKNGVVFNYENGADIRAIPDFWTQELWQATNINGYCVLAIILSLFSLLNGNRGMKRIISIILFASSVYISLVTAARTNLFLSALVIILFIILKAILNKSETLKIRKVTAKKTMLICGFVFLIFPIIVDALDRFLISLPLQAFLERLSHRHLTIKDDSRWEMWANVIKEIPNHPFGNIITEHDAHNMYLDVARISGIIPMILLIVFSIMVVVNCFKMLNCIYLSQEIRILNALLITSMLLSFMIEPVMTAKPFVFIIFCMICGMQFALLRYNDFQTQGATNFQVNNL